RLQRLDARLDLRGVGRAGVLLQICLEVLLGLLQLLGLLERDGGVEEESRERLLVEGGQEALGRRRVLLLQEQELRGPELLLGGDQVLVGCGLDRGRGRWRRVRRQDARRTGQQRQRRQQHCEGTVPAAHARRLDCKKAGIEIKDRTGRGRSATVQG